MYYDNEEKARRALRYVKQLERKYRKIYGKKDEQQDKMKNTIKRILDTRLVIRCSECNKVVIRVSLQNYDCGEYTRVCSECKKNAMLQHLDVAKEILEANGIKVKDFEIGTLTGKPYLVLE